jgi:hypothetical protein
MGSRSMLTIDNTTYLILGSIIISLLLLLAFAVQLRTKTQVCKELIKIQTGLKQTNRILATIAGIEDNSSSQPSETKVYVGNIGYSSSEADLQRLFAKFGQIEFVNIPLNKHNGKSRGYGFITFKSPSDAEKATKLNGTDFDGRQIQVNFAKERISQI